MFDLSNNRENLESPHIIILTANPSLYITHIPFTNKSEEEYISDIRTEAGALFPQEGQPIDG